MAEKQKDNSSAGSGNKNEPVAQQQIQIKAADQDLKGMYSNAMNITHTQEEFVLDFLNIMPPTGSLLSRIIVSPGHMKRIVQAIQHNLGMYESNFGSLTPAEAPKGEIGFSLSQK